MLRFHKFTIGLFTLFSLYYFSSMLLAYFILFCLFIQGHAWTSDYGCSDKEEEFHWLYK